MTQPSELLNCPLCDQEGHLEIMPQLETRASYARAGCPNCGLWLSRGSAQAAIAEWNRRSLTAPSPEYVKAAKEMSEALAEQMRLNRELQDYARAGGFMDDTFESAIQRERDKGTVALSAFRVQAVLNGGGG